MSSDAIVEVNGLTKIFPVYDKPHYRLMQMLFGSNRRWHREFTALSDINLVVRRGETVGIVGRNGSGKSTLLQIICGTLAPTEGEVHVRGRVAALLELGAGFNPEFTGRENVYLNGTVLGLTRAEIEDKLDNILAFAEIGDFIDRPVKTYSSGMYVRLAFAVAIHVEPDLLVVDEALSVGDEAFQRKCFARIERLREDGCTVLFVSHAASTVVELCDRAILIDHGDLLADGLPKAVISRYQRMLYAPQERLAELRDQMKHERANGKLVAQAFLAEGSSHQDAASHLNKESSIEAYFDEGLRSQSEVMYPRLGVTIDDPHLELPDGRRVNVINAGKKYVYTYSVKFDQGVAGARFGMMIKTLTGVEIAGAVSALAHQSVEWIDMGTQLTIRFEFTCALAGGTYFMNAGVLGRLGEEESYLDRRVDAFMFRVMPSVSRLSTGFVDMVENVDVSATTRTQMTSEL
ncbi:ABC transporter ATP-binding protein [Rhodanobacter sp. BL-MT-08]